LDERKKRIEDSLKNAEEIEKKLLKTEEDREKVLIKASTEAQKIVDESTRSAQQIIAEAHSKASFDMEDILKKGQEALGQEKEKIQQEIREELAELVAISLEKVTGKILNKKDQKDLLAKTVKNIS
jgi:F-type H+-transporting ATPase subunit b